MQRALRLALPQLCAWPALQSQHLLQLCAQLQAFALLPVPVMQLQQLHRLAVAPPLLLRLALPVPFRAQPRRRA